MGILCLEDDKFAPKEEIFDNFEEVSANFRVLF